MTNFSSKKSSAFLQSGDQSLQILLEKAKTLTNINQSVSAHLDPAMKAYCQVGNLKNNQLTLIVANGSIATQIRFQTSDLLRKFKQDPQLQTITSIQCKVRPSSPATPPPPRGKHQMQPPSPQTADIIRGIADSLEDKTLKEIMQRIANRGLKKT